MLNREDAFSKGWTEEQLDEGYHGLAPVTLAIT